MPWNVGRADCDFLLTGDGNATIKYSYQDRGKGFMGPVRRLYRVILRHPIHGVGLGECGGLRSCWRFKLIIWNGE